MSAVRKLLARNGWKFESRLHLQQNAERSAASLTRTVLWLLSLGIFDKDYARETAGSAEEHSLVSPDLLAYEERPQYATEAITFPTRYPFGTTAEFWLHLQSLHELRVAQKKVGKSIDRLPTLKHVEEARA